MPSWHRCLIGQRRGVDICMKRAIDFRGFFFDGYLTTGHPQHLVFTVQVDDPSVLRKPHDATTAGEIALRRHYVTTLVQQRVHGERSEPKHSAISFKKSSSIGKQPPPRKMPSERTAFFVDR